MCFLSAVDFLLRMDFVKLLLVVFAVLKKGKGRVEVLGLL